MEVDCSKLKMINFIQYFKAQEYKKFTTIDVVRCVDEIDIKLNAFLRGTQRQKVFLKAKDKENLFCNVVLIFGHIFRGWNVTHLELKPSVVVWKNIGALNELEKHAIQFSELIIEGLDNNFNTVEPIQVFGTSGTTSESKMVPITRTRLIKNLDAAKELYIGCKKMLSVMPLGHVNSMCGAICYSMLYEVDFIHSDFNSVVYLSELCETEGPDLLNCSPFYLETITKLNNISSKPILVPNRIVCASAPLAEDTLCVFSKSGHKIQPAYGLSEAVNFSLGFGYEDAYSAKSFFDEHKFLPTGRALYGSVVKIVNDNQVELSDNETGSIVISGDIVFDGYLGDVDEDIFFQSAIGQRFLFTGDRGFKQTVDGVPYFKITGREKETFNFRGMQRYFRDLERLIEESVPCDFYITDMHILDRDVESDTHLCIAVENWRGKLKDSASLLGLQRNIKKELGNIPFSLVAVPQIPRTRSGKIQRLRKMDYDRKIF